MIRSTPWARTLGVLVAGAYAAPVALITTTPWRGLTPAPGQARPPLDLVTLLVAVVLFVAVVLVVLGKPRSAAG